jgi:hypothetical protein
MRRRRRRGPRGAAGADSGNTPYGDLKDPVSVGPGKPFSKAQKDKIYEANRQANGGQLTDDYTGEPLLPPQQSQRGVTPSPNDVQVDHYYPRSKSLSGN